METDTLTQKIRKGLLEYCVLTALSKREVYAAELINSLKTADLITVEGTIYPLLNKLCRDGKVNYRWEESPNGPPRKYYSLSSYGNEFLILYQREWVAIQKSIKFIEESK